MQDVMVRAISGELHWFQAVDIPRIARRIGPCDGVKRAVEMPTASLLQR